MDVFSSYKVGTKYGTISTIVADFSHSVDDFVHKVWKDVTDDSIITLDIINEDEERRNAEVIGVAVEYCDQGDGSNINKIATLQLCWRGYNCIIIQLLHLNNIPNSLKDLLTRGTKEFAFVGVGIRDALADLGMYYGLKFKIVMELGPMASRVCKEPRFFDSSLEVLAEEIAKIKIEKSLIPSGSVWDARDLRTEQIDYAIAKAHAAYKIGTELMNM